MPPKQQTFTPDVASVPAARRFVREALRELRATAASDTAEMLVSELATNAVLHAHTVFTVEVDRQGPGLRVRVVDSSTASPRVRRYGTDATTGRGLRLVATLAADWGVERHGGGKTIWFEVAAEGDGGVPVETWNDGDDVDALLAQFGDDEDDSNPVRAVDSVWWFAA